MYVMHACSSLSLLKKQRLVFVVWNWLGKKRTHRSFFLHFLSSLLYIKKRLLKRRFMDDHIRCNDSDESVISSIHTVTVCCSFYAASTKSIDDDDDSWHEDNVRKWRLVSTIFFSTIFMYLYMWCGSFYVRIVYIYIYYIIEPQTGLSGQVQVRFRQNKI